MLIIDRFVSDRPLGFAPFWCPFTTTSTYLLSKRNKAFAKWLITQQ